MKATEAKLLKFLKNAPQFIIPIYQRNYLWTGERMFDQRQRQGPVALVRAAQQPSALEC